MGTPQGPPTGSATLVRASSRERYGIDRSEIDNELADLLHPQRRHSDDLTPRKRFGGGAG